MDRKNLASAAPSSPEERSSSSSPDRPAQSDAKKRPVSKKGKGSTRTVSNLTEDQLERKRANDREAQRNIRQRTKDHIKQLEGSLEEERAKVADRDSRLRQLEDENERLHRQIQSRYGQDQEDRAMDIDPRRPSMASETGPWQQAQHQSRRLSHADAMEMRATAMTSPGADLLQARPQTFPAPPPSYLNRNTQAFARNQALGQQAGQATTSPVAYAPVQQPQIEQGGSFPPRILTQQDPLRFPARHPENAPQGLAEGPPSQRSESRGASESQGPPGPHHQYPQVLRLIPHERQYQQPEHPPGQYAQYQAHGAYPLPPPPPAQQYSQQVPQYGPVESYPHPMGPSTTQQPGYTPAQGSSSRPPYGYYANDYPQPPS